MTPEFITQDEIDDRKCEACSAREHEIAGYEHELAVAEAILATAQPQWLDNPIVDGKGEPVKVKGVVLTNRRQCELQIATVKDRLAVSNMRFTAEKAQLPEGPRREAAKGRVTNKKALAK